MNTPTPLRQKLRAVADRLDEQERHLDAASWEARDHTVDAQILTGLARAWGDTLQALVHEGRLHPNDATGVLLRTAAAHSHPAARPAVVFLMPALVEAVHRQGQFDAGLLDTAEVIDLVPAGCSRWDVTREQLLDDVNEALAPLLTGTRLTVTA